MAGNLLEFARQLVELVFGQSVQLVGVFEHYNRNGTTVLNLDDCHCCDYVFREGNNTSYN